VDPLRWPVGTTPELTDRAGCGMNGNGQWAKVPEWVAYKDLDASALNVLIILAAKAGRERVAWISHRTIGEGLGMHRTTVGRAVRKLTKVGVIEEAGKVVVDRELGTWVKRYRIVDRSPDLPEVHSGGASGQVVNEASDLPEVHLGRTSVGADIAPSEGPEVHPGRPEVHIGTPEVHPGRTHSVPQYSVPQISVPLLDAQFENERDRNPNGQTPNPSAKERPGTGVGELASGIGTYSRFDPADIKDRGILCRVPGCGKYNHRRTYCSTHRPEELQPLIEKAAAEEVST